MCGRNAAFVIAKKSSPSIRGVAMQRSTQGEPAFEEMAMTA
jgi:hypothetical protein